MNIHLYKIIAFLVALLIGLSSAGQVNVTFEKENFPEEKQKELKEIVKSLKDAQKLLEEDPPRYSEALEIYLKANQLNPDNDIVNYYTGLCYLHTIQKTKAIPFLEKSLKLNEKAMPDTRYYLARAYHLNYEFDKAIESYTLYRHSLTPFQLTEQGSILEKRIKECEDGKELVKDPIRVFIDNLGNNINTKFPEYNPVISADESVLMFTSCRDNTTGGKIDPVYGEYYEDIYISRKDGDIWSQPENPGKPFNQDSHDAIVGLSPDAANVLIYKGDESGGDIYVCRIVEGEWENPKSLPKEINTKYQETSATFSPDMQGLYFVSDREGGYGGSDIYYCKVGPKSADGKFYFEDAVNLGSAINTPYDEEGVFMQADGITLYFSSRGHKTLGGFDIFKTTLENGQWTEPVNLGYPVNTTDDDVFFSVNLTGKHGYYSTFEQEGFGKRDLYRVTFLGPEKLMPHKSEYELLAFEVKPVNETSLEKEVEIKAFALVAIKGKIMDMVTQGPLGVMMEIYDNENHQMIASFVSDERTGEYFISLPSGKSYGFAVKARDYLFHSENIEIPPAVVPGEMEKDIMLKKVEVGSKIVLKNIFFEFNKATLKPESIPELERLIKLLNDVPSLKIEISGHTDNVGSELYNQDLSEKRAQAVVEYLVDKGVEQDRLTYKGYGFAQPIAGNDTEEGRAMNRRTEFKVISK
ncbi:MAG: OmpA family protein [Bacteroidetes bacterium]|nr:OmpA family protein [Bacteroidota bacterium]